MAKDEHSFSRIYHLIFKKCKFRRTHEARVWIAINDWNEARGIPEYQGWRQKFMKYMNMI